MKAQIKHILLGLTICTLFSCGKEGPSFEEGKANQELNELDSLERKLAGRGIYLGEREDAIIPHFIGGPQWCEESLKILDDYILKAGQAIEMTSGLDVIIYDRAETQKKVESAKAALKIIEGRLIERVESFIEQEQVSRQKETQNESKDKFERIWRGLTKKSSIETHKIDGVEMLTVETMSPYELAQFYKKLAALIESEGITPHHLEKKNLKKYFYIKRFSDNPIHLFYWLFRATYYDYKKISDSSHKYFSLKIDKMGVKQSKTLQKAYHAMRDLVTVHERLIKVIQVLMVELYQYPSTPYNLEIEEQDRAPFRAIHGLKLKRMRNFAIQLNKGLKVARSFRNLVYARYMMFLASKETAVKNIL